jgi:hypothetical protein
VAELEALHEQLHLVEVTGSIVGVAPGSAKRPDKTYGPLKLIAVFLFSVG